MNSDKMHENEVGSDAALVRRLLVSQFPRWADLPISELPLGGTDNALYRLGDELVVRLPRIDSAVASREQEHEWLPKLAPLLPYEIPAPLALGEPGEGYPWPWSVYRWLEGEDPSVNLEVDRDALRPDVVRFLEALRRVEMSGGPRSRRGLPPSTSDTSVRKSIDILGERIDREAAIAVWEAALAVPVWHREPVWVHADLDARNLLVKDGRLNAVIDWGCAGIGDPAYDISVAWKLFSPSARQIFRAEMDVDDATWDRARGWTLAQAVNALSYYTMETNPILVRETRRWLAAVLTDGDAPHALVPEDRFDQDSASNPM
jgi:aminoglycoside phosphotransferase (APT) family kinase protein